MSRTKKTNAKRRKNSNLKLKSVKLLLKTRSTSFKNNSNS